MRTFAVLSDWVTGMDCVDILLCRMVARAVPHKTTVQWRKWRNSLGDASYGGCKGTPPANRFPSAGRNDMSWSPGRLDCGTGCPTIERFLGKRTNTRTWRCDVRHDPLRFVRAYGYNIGEAFGRPIRSLNARGFVPPHVSTISSTYRESSASRFGTGACPVRWELWLSGDAFRSIPL